MQLPSLHSRTIAVVVVRAPAGLTRCYYRHEVRLNPKGAEREEDSPSPTSPNSENPKMSCSRPPPVLQVKLYRRWVLFGEGQARPEFPSFSCTIPCLSARGDWRSGLAASVSPVSPYTAMQSPRTAPVEVVPSLDMEELDAWQGTVATSAYPTGIDIIAGGSISVIQLHPGRYPTLCCVGLVQIDGIAA